MAAVQIVGATVQLTDDGNGSWASRQQEVASNLPPVKGRTEIDWQFGPVRAIGNVDPSTHDIAASVSIAGVNSGPIYGNLRDGLVLRVDHFASRGEVRYYLKNGNEVWTHLDIKITFDGQFDGDYKILSL